MNPHVTIIQLQQLSTHGFMAHLVSFISLPISLSSYIIFKQISDVTCIYL